MSDDCRTLVVRKDPKKRAAMRPSGAATLRRNGDGLSRFEAIETYARAAAAARRKDALCVDKIA